MKNILMISGGADSMLIYKENKFDNLVFFDYEQTHKQEEYNILKNIKYDLIKLPEFGKKNKEVNCRNLTFISIISSIYGANDDINIYIGTNKDDKYSDNNRDFFNRLEIIINSISINKISIITPLININKIDIIKKLGDIEYYSD